MFIQKTVEDNDSFCYNSPDPRLRYSWDKSMCKISTESDCFFQELSRKRMDGHTGDRHNLKCESHWVLLCDTVESNQFVHRIKVLAGDWYKVITTSVKPLELFEFFPHPYT